MRDLRLYYVKRRHQLRKRRYASAHKSGWQQSKQCACASRDTGSRRLATTRSSSSCSLQRSMTTKNTGVIASNARKHKCATGNKEQPDDATTHARSHAGDTAGCAQLCGVTAAADDETKNAIKNVEPRTRGTNKCANSPPSQPLAGPVCIVPVDNSEGR